MKIVNNTHWRTDHLRAIIQQVSLTALEGYSAKKRRLVITVVYSKMEGHHGCVNCLGGSKMTLRIPKENVDKGLFAWLVEHEMDHVRGQDHREMTKPQKWYDAYDICKEVNLPKYAWANSFPLEAKLTSAKLAS